MADPHKQHRQEILFIMSAVSWCLCCLQILGIFIFNKIRGLLIIRKRYPRLVMLEAFVSAFNLAIVYPSIMSVQFGNPAISGKWWPSLNSGLRLCTAHICFTIEACRLWLIAYDLQYLHSSQNKQWKTEIDASYSEKDWYLRNRVKWGNQLYVTKLGFIYYITTAFAVCTLEFVYEDVGLHQWHVLLVQGMFFFVPMAIPIYLYIRTPRNLQDRFLFHYVECRVNSPLPAVVQRGTYMSFSGILVDYYCHGCRRIIWSHIHVADHVQA